MTRQQSPLTPSRRTLLQYGLALSSGALVSSSASANANASADLPDDSKTHTQEERPDERPIMQGSVFPYQWTPGERFEIDETDIDWQPGGSRRTDADQGGRQTHVIRYDFSSSYRAFLFTDGESSVREGQRYRFDGSSARAVAGPNLIGVDVVPLE